MKKGPTSLGRLDASSALPPGRIVSVKLGNRPQLENLEIERGPVSAALDELYRGRPHPMAGNQEP